MRIAGVLSCVIRVLLIGCIAGGCAIKTPTGTLDFERIKEEVEKKAQIVSRIRVDFTRTRHSSTFARALTVQGRIIFEKPDRFRLTASGDVNVEVLSDGRLLAVIHDGKDAEVHTLHGDRDRALFADPLMALLEGFGNGSLKQAEAVSPSDQSNMIAVEIAPRTSSGNDKKQKVLVWFASDGTIEKARFVSDNGDEDEWRIRSWAVLQANDPEIAELDRRLQQIRAANSTVSPKRTADHNTNARAVK